MSIYITSDLHFNHNKEFIWKARGYSSVEDMNEAQIIKFNEMVTDEDDVWILGDLVMGQSTDAIPLLKRLNGKIHVVLGNHDTETREKIYRDLGWDVQVAARFRYHKISFYLSHFPTICTNIESESLYMTTVNLYGHTHQTTNFYNGNPYMYHVGVDSHYGYPVLLDNIIVDIKEEMLHCKEMMYPEGENNEFGGTTNV